MTRDGNGYGAGLQDGAACHQLTWLPASGHPRLLHGAGVCEEEEKKEEEEGKEEEEVLGRHTKHLYLCLL